MRNIYPCDNSGYGGPACQVGNGARVGVGEMITTIVRDYKQELVIRLVCIIDFQAVAISLIAINFFCNESEGNISRR